MSWLSNIDLNTIFTKYQAIKGKDTSDSAKQKEIKSLFEKETKSEDLNYEDLIQLSNKKDIDKNGELEEDETSFFNDMKSFLYEKIAHTIVRDKDFSAKDMLEFEEYIRTEAKADNADVSGEIDKIRNRMVSNLTAKFFVTTESKAYKDAAEDNAKEIEDTLKAFGEIKASKNNPFSGDTKFNTLLNKIDRRLQGVTSSSSSSGTDTDGKDGDESSIGTPLREPKKSGFDWVPHSDKNDYLYKDGEILKEGFYESQYILNGRPGTGYSTLDDDSKGLYYEKGSLKTGISTDTGKCYAEGRIQQGGVYPDTEGTYPRYNISEQGTVLSMEVLNADSKVTRTVYYVTTDKDGKETVDMETVHRIEELRKYTTESGEEEYRIYEALEKSVDGSKNNLWQEKYEYNSDGSYTLTKHYYNSSKEDEVEKYDIYGNKFLNEGVFVWNNQLYKDGKIWTDYASDGHEPPRFYYNSFKIDGKFEHGGKTLLYVDGYKFTGLYEVENKYYEDGEIKPFAYDKKNDTVYVNGDIANGVYAYTPKKGDEQASSEPKYYENGKIVENAPSEIINYIMNSQSLILANTVRMTIPTSGEVTFTAKAMIQGQYRDALIDNIVRTDGELESFDCSTELYSDIIYTDSYDINVVDSDGDTGKADVPILNGSKLTLKGNPDTVINLSIDGAENPILIDHSINFADADGQLDMKKGITVAEALSDDMSLITNYKKNPDTGKWEPTTQIAFATINELQNKDKDFSVRIFDIALNDDDKGVVLKDDDVTQITEQAKIKEFKTAELTSNGYTLTYDRKSKTTTISFAAPVNKNINITEGMSYVIKKDEKGDINKVVIYDGESITTYAYNKTENKIEKNQMTQAAYDLAIELARKLNIAPKSIEYAEELLSATTKITIDGIEYTVKEGVDKTGTGTDHDTYFLESDEFKYLYTRVNVGTEDEPNFAYKVTYSFTTNYEKDEDGNVISKVVDEKDLDNQEITRTVYNKANAEATTCSLLVQQLSFKNGLISQAKELVRDENNPYKGWLITSDYENGKVVKQTRTKAGQPTIVQEFSDGVQTKIYTVEKDNGNETTIVYSSFESLDKNVKSSKEVKYKDGRTETTSYDTNGREKTKTVKGSDGKLISEETYIYDNKGKKTGSTIKEYDSNGELKSTKTKQFGYGGDAYTITDADGNVKRYTANGEEVTGKLLTFESSHDFQISAIMRDSSNKITNLVGYKSNGKKLEYTINPAVASTDDIKNYIEKFMLSENLSSTTADDVYIEITYENNEQKQAKLSVAGTTYEVNVNGALTNDNADNLIVTWETGDNADEIYVADVMVDGFVRQRIFTKGNTDTSYTSTEALFIGSVEDARKFQPQNIMITGIEQLSYDNNGAVVIEPKDNNKITINYGRSDTKDKANTVIVGEPIKAYDVTLYATDTKLLVTKLEDGSYVIKGDKTGAVYQFGSTSYTVKTTDGYVITYDKNGQETSRIFTIGGKSIELPSGATLTTDETKKEITVSNGSGTPKIELVYNSETGALKSGKLSISGKEVTISADSNMSYYGDYIMVVDSSNKVSIYDKNLTNIATDSTMTLDKYQKLLAGVAAYNNLNSNKISISANTTYSVSGSTTSTVTITNGDKTTVISLDTNNNLTQYTVTTDNDGIKDAKTYDDKGAFLSRTLTINNKTYNNVDENAEVRTSGNEITITAEADNYKTTLKYNKADGKNTSCILTVPKTNGTNHSIPDGAAISVNDAQQVVVSKTGTNYNINLVYGDNGSLDKTNSKITVGDTTYTLSDDFDQIVITSTYISTIKGHVETQYILSSGNKIEKTMQNNKDTNACFNLLAKSKLETEDEDDEESVIKAKDMIDTFNTTTDSELRAILLYFVELNSEGVAYAVNSKFNTLAGADDSVTLTEWQTKIGASKVTSGNLKKIN